MVDDLVVVDSGNQKDRAVVFASFLYALQFGFFREPSVFPGAVFFALRDGAQEFNVARGKQIPAAIDIDDRLALLEPLALNDLVELALFLPDGAYLRGRRFLAGVIGAGGACNGAGRGSP